MSEPFSRAEVRVRVRLRRRTQRLAPRAWATRCGVRDAVRGAPECRRPASRARSARQPTGSACRALPREGPQTASGSPAKCGGAQSSKHATRLVPQRAGAS
eukprot:6177847-Pleurochrysis_carterae.AAC.1